MFRYPDKPFMEIGRAGLDELPAGYIAELKLDGWRCEIERIASGFKYTSRHNKPIPITPELRREIEPMLDSLAVGTILDAEWLGRRPGCRDESLWIFDIMTNGTNPLWSHPAVERFGLLRTLLNGYPYFPPHTYENYGAFFDKMFDSKHAVGEGIVLKREDSKYIGSFRQSALNPAWLKCKWRGGEDGLTLLEGAQHR